MFMAALFINVATTPKPPSGEWIKNMVYPRNKTLLEVKRNKLLTAYNTDKPQNIIAKGGGGGPFI